MSNFIGNCIYLALGLMALPVIVGYFLLACVVCAGIEVGKSIVRGFVRTFKFLTQEVR